MTTMLEQLATRTAAAATGRSATERFLEGRVALVTGSTSGIGLGIATALAAAGAHIVVNGFADAVAIDRLTGELAARHSVEVRYGSADMMLPGAIGAMVERMIAEFGAID